MINEHFFVAPSEAMLTGLCLEEYLLLRRINESTSFCQVSHSRIDPFMPEMTSIRWEQINDSDLPTDLEWLFDDGNKLGRRVSEPNTLYGFNDQGAYRKKIHTQRCFLFILFGYLEPHLEVPDYMRALMNQLSQSKLDMTELVADMLTKSEFTIQGESNPKLQIDNPQEIEKAVVSLIEFNEAQRFFLIGRSFGGLIAGMQLYETGYEAIFTVTSLIKSLHDLVAFPEVKRSAVARNALASIERVFEYELKVFVPLLNLIARTVKNDQAKPSDLADIMETANDVDRSIIAQAFEERQQHERRETVLPLMRRVWPAVWVAFGELLGAVRDLDQDAKQQDAASVTPRPFVSGRNESPDRIRNWLEGYERELAHGFSISGTPEKVIVGLKDAVEALTKRVWKAEYDHSYKGSSGLPSLLYDKLKFGKTTQERRFAQIALALYKGYRNEVTHDQDGFECSVGEARFFVAGIRVLLELYTIIPRNATK